jgi:hypothetical protein
MQLAMTATYSQRHLSFLELGRTRPSREMVLRLSTKLNIPLRQSNQLLLAAGYAPVWPESDFGTQNLAPITAALDHMLGQQEPSPPWWWIGAETSYQARLNCNGTSALAYVP